MDADASIPAGAWSSEDLRQWLPVVYDELRKLARHRRRQIGDRQAPGTTSLVHEAFVNLAARDDLRWETRGHFLYFASVAMRNLLIDNVKRHESLKRAGVQLSLDDVPLVSEQRGEEILELDEALTRLTGADARLGRIVECRFYGGLTIEETAEALTVSPATVKRGWDAARAWLFKELRGEPPLAPPL